MSDPETCIVAMLARECERHYQLSIEADEALAELYQDRRHGYPPKIRARGKLIMMIWKSIETTRTMRCSPAG